MVRPEASRYVVLDWAEATPAVVIAMMIAALIPKNFFIVPPARSVNSQKRSAIVTKLILVILVTFNCRVYFADDELAQRVQSAF